ncbi:MAG: TIM barrel protein [Planctomycetota bacterium]
MDRRTFLASSVAGGLSAPMLDAAVPAARPSGDRFALRYAPHFGMFQHHAGEDVVDQLEFMADEGFTALEDNGMRRRSPEEQQRIADAMTRLNMTMGVFVAHADFGGVSFASDNSEVTKRLLNDMRASVETAKRVKARWCTVVPGRYDTRLAWDYQTANVIDNLRRCAEICEPAGLTMVLEPLNHRRDHPGLFLSEMPQAFLICRAVNSPSCKILDDLYHQQITEGNLIPNLDRAWSEIAYLQVGDHPGRCEPTTGEINYRTIFRHLAARGFDGIVGMEHSNSTGGKSGERAVIDAYVAVDPRATP